MISADGEVAAKNIVFEVFNAPHYGEKFQFVDAVMRFGCIKEPRSKRDWDPGAVLPLLEDGAEAFFAGVASDTSVRLCVKEFILRDLNDGVFEAYQCGLHLGGPLVPYGRFEARPKRRA